MIQLGTILKVCDKTGVSLVQCIKVLGYSKKYIALLGDVILVSVRHRNAKRFHNMKSFKRKRFFKGTLHRAIVVRTKVNFNLLSGVFLRFNENSVILVNRRHVPVSNRIYGPISRELCMNVPTIGCMTRLMF
jgi:large subunit ribosomal protein L14